MLAKVHIFFYKTKIQSAKFIISSAIYDSFNIIIIYNPPKSFADT